MFSAFFCCLLLKTRHTPKARVYRLEHGVFFDAGQGSFCDDSGHIGKLSPAMSVLLEHFLKASDHTLTKYEIYRIMGKNLEEYSLDSFYKIIERFRKRLKQFSSVTFGSHFAPISGIRQDNFDIATKLLQAPGQEVSGLSIVYASYRYHDCHQETVLVHDDMTLDALHFLLPSIPLRERLSPQRTL